ncbi:MAG: UvrD-helicase domain-containing protein [Gemmatimonadaceae bacterium]|nr:UvrD-helicase domain-containing protein [Gemmatimonadaceae bacterium]
MTAPVPGGVMLPFDSLTVPLLDGVTLVEASAGTGKTFAITRLVLRLLLEQRVASLSEILVVTFTEKATQELVTRIRTVLRRTDRIFSDAAAVAAPGEDDLFALRDQHGEAGARIIRDALGSMDDLGVSTIHGFCQRVLAESALETRVPFRTTFVEDETEPLLRAALDWTRLRALADVDAARQLVAAARPLHDLVKAFVVPFRRQASTTLELEATDPSQLLAADFTRTVSGAFDREKQRRHLFGFDDLLRSLSRVLRDEGPDGALARRIRSRYRAALIDEFQDTDDTQFPIFKIAFDGCPLFLIGDPKQSIYRFRGADIGAYLEASVSATHRYTLLRNFRSTPATVRAVGQLFTRAPRPFRYEDDRIGFPLVTAATAPEPPAALATDGRAALHWWWVDRSLNNDKPVSKDTARSIILRATANEIVRLLGAKVPSRCIAVLLRANSEAREMKRELDAAGVPAVISGADDVLDSDEANEIARLAAAIASPYDHRDVASALATRLWGSDASEIAGAVGDGGELEWSRITDRFAALRELWRSRGVSAALGAVLAERRTAERLLATPDGERRMTNVRHVIELLHDASATDGVSLESVGAWLARERTVANTPGRRELRLETDSEAVQLLTIHKAKGLEFDIVFCPTLWNSYGERAGPLGLMPASARTADGDAVLDLGSARHAARLAAMRAEDEAEMQRVAYVALTRAVHRCYVAFGEIGRGDPVSATAKKAKASGAAVAGAPDAASKSALGWLLRPEQDGVSRLDVLQALVADSDGTMSLESLDWQEVEYAEPAGDDAPDRGATPLSLPRGQLDTWRLSSFTGLVSDAHTEATRDVADVAVLPEVVTPPTGFRAFPAGTQAGIALHDIFERLDFTRADDDAVRTMVARSLLAHGLAGGDDIAESRLDDVVAMVRRTCSAPIPGAGFALADVPKSASLREWRFDLSVQTTSVRRVADALEAHGSPHARAYAPVLRTLRESSLPGYLGGVIDLAFEHEGRWWIVDWKSNQLGAADSRYEPGVMGEVMMQAHYTLQYHIYLVALHRLLRVRVRDYDPARHWGGVAYVFLRGIDGEGERGWFRDTPTPALLQALDDALGRRT